MYKTQLRFTLYIWFNIFYRYQKADISINDTAESLQRKPIPPGEPELPSQVQLLLMFQTKLFHK
jgi:hypothetical protein